MPHFWYKSNDTYNFKFSNQGPQNLITSCHILSRLTTPCHTLSHMSDTKVISMRTLNLVHRLLKVLSHLVTYYHMLPHLITLYSPSLIEKQCEWHLYIKYPNAIISCHILLLLTKTHHTLSPMFDWKPMSMTTLTLALRLLKTLSHFATSYHNLSHLITFFILSLIEN